MSSLTPAMQRGVEAAVQTAISENVPLQKNWSAFRAHLLENCPRRVTASMLDDERDLIYDYYYQHHTQAQPVTPPRSPNIRPENGSCNSETEQLPVAEEELKSSFSPTLDEEASRNKPSETLGIFVKQQGEWDSTVWNFCKEDDCFISSEIVNRCPLERKGDRTHLTWRFYGVPKKSYRTWFIIIDDDKMESDIMLGRNWKNVESQPHEKSCYTGETGHPICVDAPRKEEYSPVPQEFPAELPTNMTFFKNERDVREYEKSLSRMRAEDALVTTAMRLSLNASLTNGEEIWSRRPVEDVRSVSSGSQGQHPTKRRSGPSNTYSDH